MKNWLKLQFLSLLQERMIFRPKALGVTSMQAPAAYGLQDFAAVPVYSEDGVSLQLWVREVTKLGAPTILAFHGNTGHWGDVGHIEGGERADYRLRLLKALAKQGCGVVAATLRGYGNSGKVSPSEAGFLKDIRSAVRYVLDTQGIRPSHVIICGESLGGACAFIATEIMTEMQKPPSMLVTIATFSSLERKIRDLHPELDAVRATGKLRHRFDSLSRLERLVSETHFYIAHPSQDTVTPKHHSQALAEKAKISGLPVTYSEISGGHITWNAENVAKGFLEVYYGLREQ